MNTPANKKGVHWDTGSLPSLPDSPFSDASSTDSINPTGSVQYINAQLIAHGFASGQGLSLDGLSGSDLNGVVKCLLGMLSQRVEDMSRAEELTTKFRTLSYDFERLTSKHREAVDKGANAEREMNVYKSKAAAISRNLQATTVTHKNTTADLQRTRTSLQALRATHQAELRKRDKEGERLLERFSKLSDAQLKLSSTAPAGLYFSGGRCANALASDGTDVLGRGKGFLEVALEDAEKARKELAEENADLRRVLLRAVNEAQVLVHELRLVAQEKADEEKPAPLTLATLFPLSVEDIASAKLAALFTSLKGCIATLCDPNRTPRTKTPHASEMPPHEAQEDVEKQKLRKVIESLKAKLEQALTLSTGQTAQIQSLFDQLAAQEAAHVAGRSTRPTDMSLELLSAPKQDEAQARLDALNAEPAAERARFTEAAVKLGRERAQLKKERAALQEETRALAVAKMLGDLPPTPIPTEPVLASAPAPAPAPAPSVGDSEQAPTRRTRELRASPRRSRRSSTKSTAHPPAKVTPLSPMKALNLSKKARPRRSSLLAGLGGLSLSPARHGVVAAPFETEFAPAFELPPPAPLVDIASMMEAVAPRPLLKDAFVLPPLSPSSNLPGQSDLFEPFGADARPSSGVPFPSEAPTLKSTMPPLPPSTVSAPAPIPAPAPASALAPVLPTTPGRSFPLAKPFARNMYHAYSPAKPSPLSRILMLSDSPPGGPAPFTPMAPLLESAGDDSDEAPEPAGRAETRGKKLEAEVGLDDDDDDESPLREKNVLAPAARAAIDKGKGRADTALPSRLPKEKENKTRPSSRAPVPVTAPKAGPSAKAGAAKTAKTSTARIGTATGVKVPAGKTGPRRVVVEPARRAFA